LRYTHLWVESKGAGQIFNLPRTDDFSRRGKVPSHLTAKVVSTVAFQNKIKNLSCTRIQGNKLNKILKSNVIPNLFRNLPNDEARFWSVAPI